MAQDRTYLRPDGTINMDDGYNPVEYTYTLLQKNM